MFFRKALKKNLKYYNKPGKIYLGYGELLVALNIILRNKGTATFGLFPYYCVLGLGKLGIKLGLTCFSSSMNTLDFRIVDNEATPRVDVFWIPSRRTLELIPNLEPWMSTIASEILCFLNFMNYF